MQRTLCIIKPDAVAAGHAGKIIDALYQAELRPLALKSLRLSQTQAEGFYAVHRERPFFPSLCAFMTSGPVIVIALEGDDAIARYRKLMGATNPELAEEGSLRKRFASSMQHNAVHGSDAPETAAVEIAYFFSDFELRGLHG
ncbi:MAG: nucleoside-diphosphate kinase [Myxococcota bacterium]|jgi:nucleoside-diphosphate kinase|nr:nucleoside-diphosphate kinase [Myxococcota bacterium]